MENNTQTTSQNPTPPSSHSEGKVVFVAVLMFVFGAMTAGMMPSIKSISQMGSSIESQENYEIAIRQIDEEESSKDAVITDSRIEMREFPTVIMSAQMNPVDGTSVSAGSGTSDSPYKCTDFNGGIIYDDFNSNANWLPWADPAGNIIGSCIAQ